MSDSTVSPARVNDASAESSLPNQSLSPMDCRVAGCARTRYCFAHRLENLGPCVGPSEETVDLRPVQGSGPDQPLSTPTTEEGG